MHVHTCIVNTEVCVSYDTCTHMVPLGQASSILLSPILNVNLPRNKCTGRTGTQSTAELFDVHQVSSLLFPWTPHNTAVLLIHTFSGWNESTAVPGYDVTVAVEGGRKREREW